MNKNFYLIILLLILCSCQGVKDALTGKKYENSDEFLVIKKNPLILPPNFYDLPTPKDVTDNSQIENIESEIEDLAKAIHSAIENNEGYISAALLARFSSNATFPRLPFEPITKEEYLSLQKEVNERKVNDDFFDALNKYDVGELSEAGPAGCDSDKCLLPLAKPEN